MKTKILKVFGFAALTALCANLWADVTGLPQAIVTEITDSATLATYKAKVVNIESIEQVDNIPSSDAVFELTPNRAWKFACDEKEAAGNAYLDWNADYTVSFDQPVAKNSMGLFGYYGDWLGIGFFAPDEIPAGFKIPLLNYMTKKSNWTYSQIRSLVGTFVCGAFNLSKANANTTMTVELRLFAPSMTPADIRNPSTWIEDGEGINTYVIKSIEYKLSDVTNVPAKADSWPELEYAGTATSETSIPVGYYGLEGSAFVMQSAPKSVTLPTACFKPVVQKEEVKVEADKEEVKEQTKVIDEQGEEHQVPDEQKTAVDQKVVEAVNEITNNKAAQEKTDTGITAEEILTVKTGDETVVKESIKTGIKESPEYTAAPEAVRADVDAALNSRDVSSKINIKLEATGVTIQQPEASEVQVTVEKAVFDVKPLATVVVVTGTAQEPETNEFTTVIKNEDLAGKTLTVRLPLPSTFVNNVRIIYTSDDPKYQKPEEYIVASQGGLNGERFCEFKVTHFSTAEVYTTTESVPVQYNSTDVLGIIRRDTGSGMENYENAIAVPWASRDANGNIVHGMTVADLITANGLGEGDELHIWISDSGTTHQSTIGGTSVTRKGTYAIFRWDAEQKKWIGAKDMGDGEIATVGTDYLIPRGAAVWYKRASTTSGDYTIVGLVSNVCETAVAAGTTDEPVMTLLVNPFPEAVNAAKIAGANGDELIINRTSSEGTNVSYTRKGDSWGQVVAGTKTIGSLVIPTQKFQAAATIPVANGQSFWYVSRGGSPTINWKQIKQ